MRGTTICRSSRVGLLLAGGMCIAGGARAQDPLQVAGERPQVHVVRQGETLWSIAQTYFADPLLWPEIYRLNTLVVEDPHWIFPGEELDLAALERMLATPAAPVEPPVDLPPDQQVPPQQQMVPGVLDTTQEAARTDAPPDAPEVEAPPAPPPPPPADANSPTIFSRGRGRGGVTLLGASGGSVYRYRPVRRGEFYSAGFLTENAAIPWARVLGDASEPPVDRAAATSSAVIYQQVEIRAPGGAMYQIGDSLLAADLMRDVPGWGNVVVPSGIVQVTHVEEDRVLARVIGQFGRVVDGQVAMPVEPFNDPGDVLPLPVDNGLDARVIGVRDLHPVPNQQDIVFIDVGREDGVVVGDVFEITKPGAVPGAPPERSAVVMIVHVRERSASGLITHIGQPGIDAGQRVRLIRKMPS